MSVYTTDTESHLSTINSLLTEHGRKPFNPKSSEYVCHTSTIPLSTTIDAQYLRRRREKDAISLFHGETTEHPDIVCSKRSCMHMRSDNTRTNEKVPSNCPCLITRTSDGEALIPICWVTYIKSLNRNLVSRIDEDASSIVASAIMFCQDSEGIFDNRYSGNLRDALNVTGWGHVSSSNYLELMDCLYWYRTNKREYKLDRLIRKFHNSRGLFELRRALKQTLFTLDGLLIKKMIVFGPEMSSYRRIAQQTARLFRDLFSEYTASSRADLEPHMSGLSVYSELKDFCNTVKELWYKGTPEEKMSWLGYVFKNKALGAFFGGEMSRLSSYIRQTISLVNNHYTTSLAWIFRCTTLAQTRNLGYVPPHLAEVKFDEFRKTISRPVEEIDPAYDELIRAAVTQRFSRSEITPEFLRAPANDLERDLASTVLKKVNLDLKGTASLDHKVSEGGKLEDARLAIRRIIDNGWTVPVRDLETNEILSYIGAFDNEFDESWNRILFWYAYQMALNWLCERGLEDESFYYAFELPDGEEFSFDILMAAIVHIMEPGKVRNLIKGTGEFAWVLTPATKILQATLAMLPEHRAGLELSAHDWMHTRRISSDSDESRFIYDHRTGVRNDNVLQVFKDWTESTDYIGKRVGCAHLGAMMAYIGFPEAYGRMILKLIREPQPVEEVLKVRIRDSDETGGGNLSLLEEERLVWHSSVNEGFMMGMPVTKPVLHLIHVSELEVVREFLKRRDILIEEGSKAGPYRTNRVAIPRDASSFQGLYTI